jgi:hypothetical protein
LEKLVINEWILHDLSGDNGSVCQRSSAETLIRLVSGPFQICIADGTPWTDKAAGMAYQLDPFARKLIRFLHVRLLIDSSKCLRLNFDQVQLDSFSKTDRETIEKAPGDDRYLIAVFLRARAEELVTSDSNLLAAFAVDPTVHMVHRVDFIWRVTGYRP